MNIFGHINSGKPKFSQSIFAAIFLTACFNGANAHSENMPQNSVDIREAFDGSGISNIVAFDGKIFVIDPNEAKIRIYSPNQNGNSPPELLKTCTIPHSFLSWKTDIKNNSLYIYDEPSSDNGSKKIANIENSSRNIIKIMGGNNTCPKVEKSAGNAPIIGNNAFEFNNGKSIKIGNINLLASDGAQILGAKKIGKLNGNNNVFIVRETTPNTEIKYYGRINIKLRILIFDQNGKQISEGIINDHDFIRNDSRVNGLYKRGFDYLTANGNHLYFIQQQDNTHKFVLTKIQIVNDGKLPEKFNFGPSELVEDPPQDSNNDSTINPEILKEETSDIAQKMPQHEKIWRNAIEAGSLHYTNFTWKYENRSPCLDGGDKCIVASDKDGNLIDAVDDKISPKIEIKNTKGTLKNTWAMPRNLINTAQGAIAKSIPYSYAGSDSVERFKERMVDEPKTPFGNIVEKLERVDFNYMDASTYIKYPLGIDCSAFVARLFNTGPRSTGVMTRLSDKSNFPIGPVNSFAYPVPDILQIKPGDMIFRRGHVMVFSNTVKIKSQSGNQKSIGYVVYEASARCGMVCKSIYEPDFFNGWWIYRPKSITDNDGKIIPNPFGSTITDWQNFNKN